jgi:hypothetical protein
MLHPGWAEPYVQRGLPAACIPGHPHFIGWVLYATAMACLHNNAALVIHLGMRLRACLMCLRLLPAASLHSSADRRRHCQCSVARAALHPSQAITHSAASVSVSDRHPLHMDSVV